ncbi:baseplate J/gp47 family protein [Paenibacillus sp. SN-8-1]|uniref:baseplate J/gp47 family protein n=1 Tax=Paenibacillus sp. SN-8-1 TaxID=3435409 RepID=UPI003D9A2516
MKLSDLPKLPDMPILEETADDIYQRWVNRAVSLASERGLPPPPTDPGEYFYDLWYPLAQEYAEQQELWTYGFIQAFPIWADDVFLEAHGWADGMKRKTGEEDDAFRIRLLDRAFTEEGSGRRKDYETWAKEIEGVGQAFAREGERNDNSIDLYLTDMHNQPVTEEFAAKVKELMWEDKRIVGHDLATHPAPVFNVLIEAALMTKEDLSALAQSIKQRVIDYAEGRTQLVYNYVAALLLAPGVENYSGFKMNGGTSDLDVPPMSIVIVDVMLS